MCQSPMCANSFIFFVICFVDICVNVPYVEPKTVSNLCPTNYYLARDFKSNSSFATDANTKHCFLCGGRVVSVFIYIALTAGWHYEWESRH